MTTLDQPREGGAVAPPEPAELEANPAFSTINPRLQIAWDATSLRALMFCPRYYQLNIGEGWQEPVSPDLDFGRLFEDAVEVGDRVLASGGGVDEAQQASFDWALEATGRYVKCDDGLGGNNGREWQPWGGRYHQLWRCTHAPKPGRKKCEFAMAGRWHEPPEPGDVCGAILPEGKGGDVPCGSPIETKWVWVAEHTGKNRETLLRAVVWYWEELGGGVVLPFVFPDGKLAAQQHFVVELGARAPTGERYLLCGYLDRLVTFGGEVFAKEIKTTGSALTKTYMGGFTPNVQIDTYDLVIQMGLLDLPIKGIMLEACQTLVAGARFARKFLHRSPAQRAELRGELLRAWLPMAVGFAEQGHWPMNRASCKMCRFREHVCSKEPKSRERFLRDNFTRRVWNPLAERGGG